MSDKEDSKEVCGGFEKVLSRHGYGFQYAVLRRAADLYGEGKSAWRFEVSELPVLAQNDSTRIDFVLTAGGKEAPIFLVAECKRANPNLANWCFVRAPMVHRRESDSRFILERGQIHPEGGGGSQWPPAFGALAVLDMGVDAFHVGLEVQTNKPGDASGSQGRGEIESTAGQVCRGLNGLVNALAGNRSVLERARHVDLLPVIFTTARLWTSETDLRTADIESGQVTTSNAGFKQRGWVCYQYHMSPALKHGVHPEGNASNLEGLLDDMYARSIAVVSVDGIAEFLAWTNLLLDER